MNPPGTTGIDWSVSSLMNLKTESALNLRYRDDLQIMTTNVYYSATGGLALVPGTFAHQRAAASQRHQQHSLPLEILPRRGKTLS